VAVTSRLNGVKEFKRKGSRQEVTAMEIRPTNSENRKMTRAEAGRKGGRTTKERYGEEHFGRIGKIGGKKGGETTKRRYGSEFYQQIGRKGGSRETSPGQPG
jgi:general stress protein YciG